MESVFAGLTAEWIDFLGTRLGELDPAPIERCLARADQGLAFPRRELVFRAFSRTKPANVRAVILGQDPYPNGVQACGLAFSVPAGAPRPHSLGCILAELRRDEKVEVGHDATLERWAEEGVLLLNTALTVGVRPGTDLAIWNAFTSVVLGTLAARRSRPIVFLLWGEHAKSWRQAVEHEPHAVVPAPHPASRGRTRFKGSRPFSGANEELTRRGEPPINWRVSLAD
jgi:uracil-DNA glycosylase